jgi:hypothetical protein
MDFLDVSKGRGEVRPGGLRWEGCEGDELRRWGEGVGEAGR